MSRCCVILILLCFFFSCATAPKHLVAKTNNHASALSYSLTPVTQTPRPYLNVVIAFNGTPSGTDQLVLPDKWGGEQQLYRGITNIRALSPHTHISDSTDPKKKLLSYPPNTRVEISYDVQAIPSGLGRSYNRPMMQQGFVHLIGETFLLHPERVSNETIMPITLAWQGLPHGWQTATSFGVNQSSQTTNVSLKQFKFSIFAAGDLRITKTIVRGKPVYLAIRGAWSFEDSELASLITKNMEALRAFWHDDSAPYYLVTVVPSGQSSGRYAGTSLFNAFALFLSASQPVNQDLAHLVTHELMHHWNGNLMARAWPEELVFWFSEGFTEYYSRLINLRTGVLSLHDYVAGINRTIRDYYTSRARQATASDIMGHFWNNESLSKIPYLKGDLLAQNWAHRIKETTGTATLDQAMRDLLAQAKKNNTKISSEIIARTLIKYLPSGVQNDIDQYISQGGLLRPEAQNLGPCVTLANRDVSFQQTPAPLNKSNHWADAARYLPPQPTTVVQAIPQYIVDEEKFRADPQACLGYFGM